MMRKCYCVSRSSIDENNYSVSKSWILYRHGIAAKLTSAAASLQSKYAKDKKVPQEERQFLIDQRTSHNMMIGHVNIICTTKLQKRQKRMAKEMATATKYGRTTTSITVSEALVQEDVYESCDDNGADAVDDSSENPQTAGTALRPSHLRRAIFGRSKWPV